MNTKGQTIIVGFMIGVTIIVLALAFAPGLRTQLDSVRNSANLDCTNSSISDFDQAACIVADLNLFLYIGGLIFLAGAVIIAKKAFF